VWFVQSGTFLISGTLYYWHNDGCIQGALGVCGRHGDNGFFAAACRDCREKEHCEEQWHVHK